MAALNNIALQDLCRTMLPVTVVRDEDYTVLTPAQIAAAWSAYSGGTDGVYLQNIAGVWAKMDPDLPKANDRGLYIGGGGTQRYLYTDFSDCTVGQALPATRYLNLAGTVTAKTTVDGLPSMTITFAGTPSYVEQSFCDVPQNLTAIPANTPIQFRFFTDIDQLDTSYEYTQHFYWFDGESQVRTAIQSGVMVDFEATSPGTEVGCLAQTTLFGSNDQELTTPNIFTQGPSMALLGMTVPEHVYYINTTNATQTIVPEIVQRPWEYEGPWSVELEFETPPRNLGNSPRILEIGADADNRLSLIWNQDKTINVTVRIAGVTVADEDGDEVAPNETVKCVVYQTSQVTTFYVAGVEVASVATGRILDGVESLGHAFDGTLHAFANIVSYKQRKGLATGSQLEEWSTAA